MCVVFHVVQQAFFTNNNPFMVKAHLIKRTPDVDGAVLNDFVDHFRDGLGEVRVGKLGRQRDTDDVMLCCVNSTSVKVK